MGKRTPKRPAPGNEREIQSFIHCGLCVENPEGPQPSDIEVGFTPIGLQVWCRRHGANIVHIDFGGLHIDFGGQKHPANTTRKRRASEVDDDSEEGGD